MSPTTTVSRPRRRPSAPAALAILYPKVGNVLRVPLRRTYSAGPGGWEQHPERQFITWFNRMAAARPGFPLQIKSILLITGAPLCDSCHRALARHLNRYHLADKLRLRSSEPTSCGCGGGHCQHSTQPADAQAFSSVLLDQLIADSELEGEGWWDKAKDWGKVALVTGAAMLPPQGPHKPIRDAVMAWGEADKQRNQTQQTVDDNTPKSSRRPGQQELSVLPTNAFAANDFSREFEQELTKQQKKDLQDMIVRLAEQLRQLRYKGKTKPGRSGDPVKAQVNRNVGAELVRTANSIGRYPQLLAEAAGYGISSQELSAALKNHGTWLIGKASQSRHKELEAF